MVIPTQQSTKSDDEDDEDLEALRLAALQSLRAKDTVHNKKKYPPQVHKEAAEVTHTFRPPYRGQRPPRRGYFHNRLQRQQNGVSLYFYALDKPCNRPRLEVCTSDSLFRCALKLYMVFFVEFILPKST